MRTREMASSFLAVPQIAKLKDQQVAVQWPLALSGPEDLVETLGARLREQGYLLSETLSEARMRLVLEVAPRTPWRHGAGDEAYRLEVRLSETGTPELRLAGGSRRALLYGMSLVESLLQRQHFELGVFEDWPSFAMRGLVEGFYGTPWSNERRLEVLTFLHKHRFNYYIYAPKSDPYHRDRWREPYPKLQLGDLEQQIKHATALGISWVFAVSPGLSLCYTSQDDFTALIDKLEAIYALGCRDFGLFFDDVPDELVHPSDESRFGSLAEAQTDLIGRLYQRFQRSDDRVHFFICPTVYSGVGNSDYLRHLGQHLPAGVDVFWTGPAICSERITSEMAETVGQVLGRAPVLWDNYPVNDGVMEAELHMAPYAGREDSLHRVMSGVFANPMTLPEASKIPLACVGAYAWNPRRYRANAVWEQAIRKVTPETASAFERFCACNPMSCLNIQPKLLTETLETFHRTFWSGDFHGSILQLHDFFAELQQDIAFISENLDNKVLLCEVRPWLEDTQFFCQLGRVGALCYRKAVEILTAQGQHPAAEVVVRHQQRTRLELRPNENAGLIELGSGDFDELAARLNATEAQELLISLLQESIYRPTKATGYVIHAFAQDALHALLSVIRASPGNLVEPKELF